MSAAYRDLTEHYLGPHSPHRAFHADRLGRMAAHVHAGERVLDVGCNGGYLIEFLPRSCEVHGIDPSEVAVAVAQERLVSACVGAAESLPFPDKSFDAVVMGYVLERVSDPAAVLREAARVARRVVVGDTPHADSVMWGRGRSDLRSYMPDEVSALLSAVSARCRVDVLPFDGKPGMCSFAVELGPTIAVAIETIDRRKQGAPNYVADMLADLGRAGVWNSPHLASVHVLQDNLMCEEFWAPLRPLLPSCAVVDADNRGRRLNALTAIRVAASQGADWVLTLEDDISVIDGFLGSAAAWLSDHSDLGAVMYPLGSSWGETVTPVNTSLYAEPGESVLGPGASFQYTRRALAKGADHILNPGYWGGQAIAWKTDVAQSLAVWLEQHLLDPDIGGKDVLLQKWGQTRGVALPFCVPAPSFVQHVGHHSYMDTPFFEFPFPGRSWSYKYRGHA